MTFFNKTRFLELESLWKDDDMFALKATVSNGIFSGATEVYDQFECISDFAKKLIGYPQDNNMLFYEAGEKDSYAYFSMKYYPINKRGHIGVEITIESKVNTVSRPEEKSKLKLELIVHPNSIDTFQKELVKMVKNEAGTAILYGE